MSSDLTVRDQLQLHEGEAPLRVEILVEFARALIQNNPSSDVLLLSLAQVQRLTGATDEEMDLLKVAVLSEASNSPWPDGFFA